MPSNTKLSISPTEFDTNQKFREIFGLPNDTDHIINVMHNNRISTKFGVALTVEEENLLSARLDWHQERKPKLIDYLRTVDGFAWLYTDQANGGVINIGLTEDIPNFSSIRENVIEIFEKENLIRFHTAKYTERFTSKNPEFIE